MRHIFTIFSRVCHCESRQVGAKQSLFCVVAIALLLFYPSHGFTQVKEIVSEGAYNMGDGETPTVAESRALLNAKRVALEQAGTYVESYTKVENMQVTEDEIQVLSSGIMEVEILDKKRTIVGDGFRFWVKIKARVNPDNIKAMANKVKAKDKSFVDDYKKIQEAYDKSQKEIGELKKQLAQAKGEKEKKQVEAKISDDERLFQANEWFEKGYQHSLKNEHDSAIEAYTSAITLNPKFVEAYNNRGVAYKNQVQYDRAIEDFSKAIAINPNDADAYYNRGNAYNNKRQFDRAIEDFNKAIAINPNDAEAYYNRGLAYENKGQYNMVVEDYSRAIAINPNHALAYIAYIGRGAAYDKKGQYDMALEDYNRAIVINPNLALAYTGRGLVYYMKGNMGRAISDFQKACDMGNENGCKGLQIVLKKR
ncbi:MAG: tetratricopeptide repeat protein [Nitrospirae bacterium]|nr:tetratricopeptide repeat protein [Nitrospirota bacterium]